MNFTNAIRVVDTHTVGQDTRIIVGGIPVLKGSSMMEKKQYFMDNYDEIRRLTMLEPRGHANMFGAILTEPTVADADYGMLFIDGEGCLNMCGHGTIGVATMLVETGMVRVTEPFTELTLEAPAGLIRVRVKVLNGHAVEASFQNVPSFLYAKDVFLDVPDLGRVCLDIAFGGSFFGIVNQKQLGIENICPENVPDIVPRALALMRCVNEHVQVQHPLLPINKVELIEVYGPPKTRGVDVQNIVVLGHGEVDRSPCGTGTCAKVATLVARGNLELGQEFVHESVLRTSFKAKALEKVKIGEFDGIIPEITGSAYITGFNHLVVDRNDPLKYGFVL
ncbi:proline racemase family protein [Caproiciproducens sp.]